jgi:16S rRNA processing protein RimM
VVKPQGRLGEVAVEVLTDFPERFAERRRLFVLDASGARCELRLENFWPHKGRLVLKFEGVDSINDAETLAGCEVQIPRAERAELEAGASYVSDLVGCLVVDGKREVGTVADVQFGAGEAPLLVVREGTREYLVPLAQAYLKRMDTAAKRIEMTLPEGMLELDQPLTQEEKERQRRGE